ncbi:hypothetical protein CVT26_007546, partial [Gymnopilus dilepis]
DRLRSWQKASAQQEKKNDEHYLHTIGSGSGNDKMPQEKTKKPRKPSASPLPPTPSRLRPAIKTTPKGRHLTGASKHRKELLDQMRQQSPVRTSLKVQSTSPSPDLPLRESSSPMPSPTDDRNPPIPGRFISPSVLQAGQGPQPQLVYHPTLGWGYVMQPVSPLPASNDHSAANSPNQVGEPQGVQARETSHDAMSAGSTLASHLDHDIQEASNSFCELSRIEDDAESDGGVDAPPAAVDEPQSGDDRPETPLEPPSTSNKAPEPLQLCREIPIPGQTDAKSIGRDGPSDNKIDDVYAAYRAYFSTRINEELQRLPEDERPQGASTPFLQQLSLILHEDPTTVTDSLIEAAYNLFMEETPDYKSVLSNWWQIYQISNSATEHSNRPAQFDAYARKLQILAEHASTLMGFETAVCIVGRDIETDQALSTAISSPMVRGFFHDRLGVSEGEVMAHLKAHVYNNVSKKNVPNIPRILVAQPHLRHNEAPPPSDEPRQAASKAEAPTVSYEDGVATETTNADLDPSNPVFLPAPDTVKIEAPVIDEVPGNKRKRKKASEGDPRVEELKKRLFGLTKDCGIRQLLKAPVQFSKLPEILSAHGWVLKNWPEEMRFPCDIRTGKGVAGLSVQEQDCLLNALQHPQFPLQVHKESDNALPASEPAIIGIPPAPDSNFTHGRRKFLDEKKSEDRNGPARLTLKPSSSQFAAPVTKATQVAGVGRTEGSRKRSSEFTGGSDRFIIKKARFALSDVSESSESSDQCADNVSVPSDDEGQRPRRTLLGENNPKAKPEGSVIAYSCRLTLLKPVPS